jgi:hypothetical protein
MILKTILMKTLYEAFVAVSAPTRPVKNEYQRPDEANCGNSV